MLNYQICHDTPGFSSVSCKNLRDRRRKEIANLEKERMIRVYDIECGNPILRKASVDELNKIGRKTDEEYVRFMRYRIENY